VEERARPGCSRLTFGSLRNLLVPWTLSRLRYIHSRIGSHPAQRPREGRQKHRHEEGRQEIRAIEQIEVVSLAKGPGDHHGEEHPKRPRHLLYGPGGRRGGGWGLALTLHVRVERCRFRFHASNACVLYADASVS